MHVVQVVFSLDVGGQERVVLDLARGLIARGHRATVISLSEGGTLRPQFAGIPIETIAAPPGLSPSVALRLAAAFHRLRPDVVHTHNRTPRIYGGLAARMARVPRVIHTKHNGKDGGVAVRVLSHLYDSYIAVSDDTAHVARDVEHVPDRRLHVIANGIDVDGYTRDPGARARIRGELGVGDDVCLIGTVGRLVPEKNYELLLAAVRGVLDDRVRLAFVGDGPESAALHAAADPAIRDRVYWLGVRHDIPALLSAFDVFALSSRTEGLPLSVLEAMASQLPVVATAVGGVAKLVHDGVSGVLVTPGDVAGYHDAIDKLAHDPAYRRALGQAARDEAQAEFSVNRVVDDYLAVYA